MTPREIETTVGPAIVRTTVHVGGRDWVIVTFRRSVAPAAEIYSVRDGLEIWHGYARSVGQRAALEVSRLPGLALALAQHEDATRDRDVTAWGDAVRGARFVRRGGAWYALHGPATMPGDVVALAGVADARRAAW